MRDKDTKKSGIIILITAFSPFIGGHAGTENVENVEKTEKRKTISTINTMLSSVVGI